MSQQGSTRRLWNDAAGATLIRCISIGLTFGATVVTARLLSHAEMGVHAASLSLAVLLATIAPLGSDRVLVQRLSLHDGSQRAGLAISAAHVAALLMCLTMIGGLLAIGGVLHVSTSDSTWPRTLILSAIVLVPQTLVYLRQWIAIPLVGTRAAVAPEQILLPAIYVCVVMTLLQVGVPMTATATALSYAGVLAIVFGASVLSGGLRRVFADAMSHGVASRQDVVSLVREGLPFLTVAMGAVWTQSCVPLLVAMSCGLTESVFLSLALPFAVLSIIPLGVVNLSLMPQFSRLQAAGDTVGAAQLARRTASITLLLATVASGLIYVSSPLIPWLLGAQYIQVRPLLPALLLACIVDALTGPTIPVMQTMNMQAQYSRLLAMYCPIQFALIVGLGRVLGVDGAALAYLISRCLWNVIVVRTIHRQSGILMLPDLSLRWGRERSVVWDRSDGSRSWHSSVHRDAA